MRTHDVHSSLFTADCTKVQLYNFIHRFLRGVESYFTAKIILSISRWSPGGTPSQFPAIRSVCQWTECVFSPPFVKHFKPGAILLGWWLHWDKVTWVVVEKIWLFGLLICLLSVCRLVTTIIQCDIIKVNDTFKGIRATPIPPTTCA